MSQAAADPLSGRIHTIRNQRVMLDTDLARLYGTTTKVFNQAIKRNAARFPKDFVFQLTQEEFETFRSQIVTGSKTRHRNIGCRPWAFSKHGAVMAANVLRSPKAVQMSVYVVRAFVAQREALATNQSVLRRLAEIDKTLLQHNTALRTLWGKLRPLLAPPPEPPRKEMGFHTRLKKG